MQLPYLEKLPFGISCIDTGLVRPGLAACYLMEQRGEVALIETGIRETVERIFTVLERDGIEPDQVKYVIITHVHLDHAGGAGLLIDKLPNAKLVVHPRGARHMIDPAKLRDGAIAVYGLEKYTEMYGDLIPIPEDRIITADDGDTLELGDRTLTFIDTPGHARHHFCIFDQLSRGIFSGDTLGICYSELSDGFANFVMPTTTPVQFDPPALHASVQKLLSFNPERIFLTHFGMVDSPREHADKLLQQVGDYVSIAQSLQNSDDRQRKITGALLHYTLEELDKNGSPLSATERRNLLSGDMHLNAMGLDTWLSQQDSHS